MIPKDLETGADCDSVSSAESEMLSTSNESSCYRIQDGGARAGTEPKKLKKLRSVKLSRLPSLRSSTRRATSRYGRLPVVLSANPSSEGQSVEMSDAPPSYMKPTSSSDARKECLQNSVATSTKRSSLKPGKSLKRLSSRKIKRSLIGKSSGGTEVRRKVKKSRSIKLANLEGQSPSTGRMEPLSQASPSNPESRLSSNGKNRTKPSATKPKSALSGNKSVRALTRTSSLKPVKVSTKLGTFKSKKPSTGRGGEICQSPDSSVLKATCSSILKDAKFPDTVELELQPGEREAERKSVAKVCSYTYCSLHGHHHHHNASPPLKRFVSMRRRLLKTQKSMKRGSQLLKGNRSRNVKKGMLANERVHNGDSREESTDVADGVGKSGGEDELYNSYSESIGRNLNVNFSNFQPADKIRRPMDDRFSESTGSNSVVSSDFEFEPLEEPRMGSEEKNNGYFQGLPIQSDSKPNSTNDLEQEMQSNNKKYIRMWHLIYKHAVVGINRKVENKLPLDGLGSEEHAGDANTLLGSNNSGSWEGFSEKDENATKENCDADHHNNGLSQIEAIKLVQEAFDDILLQECQDHSTDERSIASSISSDQELLEKSHGQVQQSSSSDPAKDCTVQDPEETLPNADSIRTHEEEKTESNMTNKSGQKTLKGWSNLKKLMLLKRFVKALEKARTLKPRRPHFLSLKPDPEAEKVHLRHQTTDDRKNTEEWMLDNALQHVISKLAPAQKRKVALLIEAFETVLPLPEIETSQRSNTDPIQASNGSSTLCGGETDQENNFEEIAEMLFGRRSYPGKNLKGYPDQVTDILEDKSLPPMKSSELKETKGQCHCIKREQEINSSQPTDEDWKEKQIVAIDLDKVGNKLIFADSQPDSITSCSPELKVPSSRSKSSLKRDEILSKWNAELSRGIASSSELLISGSEPEVKDSETNILIGTPGEPSGVYKCLTSENSVESKENSSVVPSASLCEPSTVATLKERNEGAELESGSPPGFSPFEESQSDYTTDIASEARLEKQRNMRLWYLVYKHMVSGTAAEDGAKPHLDEAGNEEPLDDANSLPVTSISGSGQNFSEMDQDVDKDDAADEQKVELQRIEAIKLVEEAIDEIVLPEILDSTNNHLSTSDIIPDEGPSEEKLDERAKPFVSNCKDSFKVSHKGCPEEKWLTSGDMSTQEEGTITANAGKNQNREMPRGWSNLKKWILLKRFIKSLEKVRKFTPWKPRYLSLEQDPEGEKVNLRHQDMNQRRNSEEWMLDYALQQVVAKLTPARKRKVDLLVQAFETVIPTVEVETHDPAASTFAKLRPRQTCH